MSLRRCQHRIDRSYVLIIRRLLLVCLGNIFLYFFCFKRLNLPLIFCFFISIGFLDILEILKYFYSHFNLIFNYFWLILYHCQHLQLLCFILFNYHILNQNFFYFYFKLTFFKNLAKICLHRLIL